MEGAVGGLSGDGLLQMLLGEQQELPFVDRFTQAQSSGGQIEFQRSGFYRELIPDRKPNPGEQLAFQVNLDACNGCKACVSACHSLNGLDEDETWRDVGLLIGHDPKEPYQQHITTACHHCVDPACLNGCPVLAYEKDPVTGIVRHLADQCIGCQYCVLKCPYDVPKYSKQRGIVRKCDMCFNRLARNEAPACAQACPTGAITIQIVSINSMAAATARSDQRLVPGAFESSYTQPTTAYVGRKSIPPNARPSDQSRLRLEHPHWPLIVMLVLTQMAVGLSVTVLGPNWIQDDHRSSQPRDLHLAHSRAGREHPSSGASARGLAGLAWASDVLDEPRNRGFRWLFRIRSGADDCSLAATEMVYLRCFDPTESVNPGNSRNRGNWYPQYRLLSDDLYRQQHPTMHGDFACCL